MPQTTSAHEREPLKAEPNAPRLAAPAASIADILRDMQADADRRHAELLSEIYRLQRAIGVSDGA